MLETLTMKPTVTAAQICAVSPVFGYDGACDRFCVTAQGRAALEAICRRETGLVRGQEHGGKPGTNLVAIYVTENPEPEYCGGPETFGRVVALVRPLPMPARKTVLDFESGCKELRRNQLVDRWPCGWPCEVVFFSPHGGPGLRDVVWKALHISNYGDDFACQMMQGPIDLMRGVYAPLRRDLMIEVRHQIKLNPLVEVRPF
jgi:hypothetical protein